MANASSISRDIDNLREIGKYVKKKLLEFRSAARVALRPILLQMKATKQYLKELSSRTPHLDPTVEAELKHLQEQLKRLQDYAKHVIAAYRNLVFRLSNSQVIDRIKFEIRNGHTHELKQFLAQVQDCLAKCFTRTIEFNSRYELIKQELDKAQKTQKAKIQKKDGEISKKVTGMIASGAAAVGGTAAAIGFGVATVATGGTVAIVAGVVTGVAIAGAAASSGATIGLGVSTSISTKERELIRRAAKSLLDMQHEINQGKEKIFEMEKCIQQVKEVVEGSKSIDDKGLKDFAEESILIDGSDDLLHEYDISFGLDQLQEAMKELLSIIDD